MTLCRTSLNGLVHTSLILSGGASELVIGHLRLPVSSTRIFRSFLETISDTDIVSRKL